MNDMSKDFTKGAVTKSTGPATYGGKIPFGKSMINSIDRGYSPIMKSHEVIAEKVREQENLAQIVRDNFLKTR